jgi:putative N6-adenine-specific DNA methylase
MHAITIVITEHFIKSIDRISKASIASTMTTMTAVVGPLCCLWTVSFILLLNLVSIESFRVPQTFHSGRRASVSSSTRSAAPVHSKALAFLPAASASACASTSTSSSRADSTRRYANGRKGSGGEYRNDHADSSSYQQSQQSYSSASGPPQRSREQQYLATCIPGCASILANELTGLNCWNVVESGNSAVQFTADTETALKTLLWTRTAHKIMEFVCESGSLSSNEYSDNDGEGIYNRDDLYKFVRHSVDVKDLLGDGQGGLLTLSVQTILNGANRIPTDINHSHYTALTIKNALTDAVRDLREDRPNVDLDDPDVPIVAVLLGTDDGAVVSLYRQLHPTGTLHKRGYRGGSAIHKAAMKESMAAALLMHAGWPEECRRASSRHPVTLIDPMVGSGSLLLEAACMAGNVAPGLMRIKCGLPGHSMPPVTRWKGADNSQGPSVVDIWKRLLTQATAEAKQGLQRLQSPDCPIEMIGNDIHPGALDLFEAGLHQAGLTGVVQVTEGDCLDWDPEVRNPEGPWMIVSNPPWDIRLTGDMHTAWEAMRVFLRETVPSNTNAWVLSGNPAATKHLGLRKTPSTSLALKTGEQDLRWIQYQIRDKNATVAVSNEDGVDGWGYKGDARGGGDGDELVASRSPAKPFKPKVKQINDADNAWLID